MAECEWANAATVCLIKATVDNNGRQISYKGTGFHFGSGWIMSVAHNFQNDDRDSPRFHSVIADAQFEVQFEDNVYVFGKHERMAFVHHLEPGEYADYKNKDIAMVKLGVQYEYARDQSNYTEWEKEEKIQVEKMKVLAEINPPTPQAGEDAYTIHYGGGDDTKKMERTEIIQITQGDKNRVPMLHLEKPAGILAAGASGCPVMIKRDETYHLVGLHFSGDNDDEDGESQALPWNRGIGEYIHKGVEIIAKMNSYLANEKISSAMPEAAEKASETMSELEATAKKCKLTIYFPNGDV